MLSAFVLQWYVLTAHGRFCPAMVVFVQE